jgi:hypothetical protein
LLPGGLSLSDSVRKTDRFEPLGSPFFATYFASQGAERAVTARIGFSEAAHATRDVSLSNCHSRTERVDGFLNSDGFPPSRNFNCSAVFGATPQPRQEPWPRVPPAPGNRFRLAEGIF